MGKKRKPEELFVFPDKYIDRSTITNKLRDFIKHLSGFHDHPTYLEVGCHKGYTLFSVSNAFEQAFGLDIDIHCISFAESLKKQLETRFKIQMDNLSFLHCPTDLLPRAPYHVVLIDAAHDYSSVKNDFDNVTKANTAEKYHVVFHDFGLKDAGVKRFVEERFPGQFTLCGEKDGWNPKGEEPVVDWEAAWVLIDRRTGGKNQVEK